MSESALLAMAWILMGYGSILVVAAEFTRHGASWSYLFTWDNFLWQVVMVICGPISLAVSIVDYRNQSKYIEKNKR